MLQWMCHSDALIITITRYDLGGVGGRVRAKDVHDDAMDITLFTPSRSHDDNGEDDGLYYLGLKCSC
jgi:hypothetical protein